MTKLLKILTFVLMTTPAQAQMVDLSDRPAGPQMVIKTYNVELPLTSAEAARELRAEIGHLVDFTELDGIVMAGFAGFGTPEPLRAYLLEIVPGLSPGFLSDDMPVSLSIALMPADAMTVVQVMLSTPQSEETMLLAAGVPEGGVVLMDDASPKACTGQVVVSHKTSVEVAAETYSAALEAEGFTMQPTDTASTSFFVGHRGDCALFLYTQPDFTTPDHAMVVVRFKED